LKDDRIDRIFEQAPKDMPATLAEKIRARIQSDTQPVKPLPGGVLYALLFTAIFGLAGTLFAAILGFAGLHALSWQEAIAFLIALAALAFGGSAMVARSMRPASGSLHSWILASVALVAYELLVLTFFRDYSMASFIHRGVVCLLLGVLCGTFAALPAWFVVRSGFVVEPGRAGAIIGLIGGLAGLLALTLHCPFITTPHAGVWHAAVIPVCVAVGAIAGRRFLSKR
jgi:hypothetical protein